MPDDTYLVTGALGCIGSWVVRQLLEEGESVVALDAGTNRERFNLVNDGVDTGPVTFEHADITEFEDIRSALDRHRVTKVIHLAALQVPFCREDPINGALVNVVGTVNVFEAVKHRREHVSMVAYAGSIGMFDVADADAATRRLPADSGAHPRSHYGVYKQANEGTARIYWEDDKIASVGLRPFVVYGPGRDQGLTSSPTMAMLAAALGLPYHITYGGRVQMQFAPDVAAAFVSASRSTVKGAYAANLGGPVASITEVIEAIEAASPASRGTIDADDDPLPFPDSVDSTGLEDLIGPLRETALEDGVALTLRHFIGLRARDAVPASLVARLRE